MVHFFYELSMKKHSKHTGCGDNLFEADFSKRNILL